MNKLKSGMIFSKRELLSQPPKRQALHVEDEHTDGETFRQKNGKKDRILNLVLN